MADFDPTRFRFPTAEAVQGLATFCEDLIELFTMDPVVEPTVTDEEMEDEEEEQLEAVETADEEVVMA